MEKQQNKRKLLKNDHIMTVLLCSLAIPLSMSMWIANLFYSKFISNDEGFDEPVVISPSRWLAACVIPIIISTYGYKKKSLSISGALLVLFGGFVFTLSNFSFTITAITALISSSKATKFREHLKRKFEEDFKEGGQRNWIQILCNTGMAIQLSLLYILDVGVSEKPIDFVKDYRASWLSIGFLGVMGSCSGDTWASELGPVLSHGDPYLITTWKKVPKGTNGGVSLTGTLCSTAGGLLVGLCQYLSTIYFADRSLMAYAPPQWPIILFGGLAGFLGSLFDSIFGATLQYSGLDEEGKIVSYSHLATKHLSGRNILDNHSVNLITTVVMGILLPTISKNLWPLI